MAILSGFQLQIQTPTDESVASGSSAPATNAFSVIGAIQSNSIEIAASEIDITTQSSNENREILNDRGIKNLNINVTGLATDSSLHKALELNVFSNKLRWFRLVKVDDSSRTYLSRFKISNLSQEGAHDGAVSLSFSLMSSGAVVIT